MDYHGRFVFSNFGVRHVASQRFVFTKNNIVVFLLDHIFMFPQFFELKKTRINIWRRLVQKSARELDILPFGAIWDNVGTKTTPA